MKHGLVLLAVLALAGCSTAPIAATTIPDSIRDDVGRLLAHPEAKAAFKAAPNFTQDALETIARLDHELSSPRP